MSLQYQNPLARDEKPPANAGMQLNEQKILAAIDWKIIHETKTLSPSERQKFEQWLAADSANQLLWDKLGAVLQTPIQQVQQLGDHKAVRSVVSSSSHEIKRRAFLSATLGLSLYGFWQFEQTNQAEKLFADLSSKNGERLIHSFSDGSQVLLNAKSVANVYISEHSHRIHLYQGQVLATTGKNKDRQFLITTEHGSAEALGTEFLLVKKAHCSLVVVLKHQVRIRTEQGRSHVLNAGESARFTADKIEPLQQDLRHLAAWRNGFLEVQDMPLKDVIAAINDYHPGWIRLADDVASLRVFGVFQLDESYLALQALSDLLPIKIRHIGRLLTLIEAG